LRVEEDGKGFLLANEMRWKVDGGGRESPYESINTLLLRSNRRYERRA